MTCDAQVPAAVWPPKDPEEKLDYGVSFEQDCARLWEPYKDYVIGSRIRVFLSGSKGAASGYEFQALNAGRTGGKMPTFPAVLTQTVKDGSITWTCVTLSAASLRALIVGTPTWVAVDTGLTITGTTLDGLTAGAFIAGGVHGSDYAIKVQATLDNGATPMRICVLPVRRAERLCADA